RRPGKMAAAPAVVPACAARFGRSPQEGFWRAARPLAAGPSQGLGLCLARSAAAEGAGAFPCATHTSEMARAPVWTPRLEPASMGCTDGAGMAGRSRVMEARPMKILFLVSSLNTGGAERVATTLASAWSRRGDDVTLVSTFPQRGSCFYPLDAGVKLVWLADRLGDASRLLPVTVAKLRAMRALMIDEAPDVVISFLTNVNVMALLAHWGLRTPIVVCERTNPAAARNSGAVLRAARRLTYPKADVVTVQAASSVEAFRRMVPGIRRLEVVSNPLPPELFERSAR